ncbi:OsmC family protein [Carboxylicivirga mesophila]|uniref:OsmC family protein n=1 Tax=Carboxylicivirga mesophila TaxID=1166478 RepID=A0ABS5K7G5_9BACT|nr:OsmC family protein [Carboxylicivirga mesophila]MBS2210827.1 OsmC family protein [Carboxylicivirga mesophila]
MAISTLKVGAKMQEGFRTEIECSHNFIIDQPKPAGTDEGPNPMEIYLSSIPACICAIGRIIANQKRLPVRSISVKLEGDIDKDYLLGKTQEGRAGFVEIRTKVEIDADMTAAEKELYLCDIEKRCPIADNTIYTTSLKTELVG